ncbi:lytic murein transglycosylase [Thalassotalea sp. Y01]|uniref:lytic murein transglycosylase n=1 Tax=Thalassotalea sp. Y01 TaxID=2729613 RepID=UPI00145F704C|nr:lytic murein transglycosylase [Thalassotalea sp. Y01]NMP16591.1 lytic murein transglycosylase [Thalassotalea sp. Y01]
MKKHLAASILALGSVLALPLSAQTAAEPHSSKKMTFEQYIEGLKQEAREKGFSEQLIASSFADVSYHKRAVKADRNQPEVVETLETYLPKRVPDWKVNKAKDMMKKYHKELTAVGKQYGVQPRFIVSLWALESNFGKITGNFDVISALSTMAYDGRREAFFKSQVFDALTILQQGHIQKADMKGSWAGAMGHNQFMPSSFLSFAADGDGDGKKDIWNNTADVFASIANYLSQVGWNNDITWARQVKLPQGFDNSLAIPQRTGGRKPWLQHWSRTEMSLSDWQKVGVRRYDGSDLPNVDMKAALVFPDGEQGRAYLAYDNYKSLMHWNTSYYFVTSVGHLADRIKFSR